jgi:ATP adenylyltransferase/5',5'''-P-1,P-4-tetraphosphate phosphorylase II
VHHPQVVPLPLLEGQPAVMPTEALLQPSIDQQQQQQQQAVGPLQPFAARGFPLQAYAARLPEDVSGQQLQACLDSLLLMAEKGAAAAASGTGGTSSSHAGAGTAAGAVAAAAVGSMSPSEEPLSYNVLLTREWALLVPRSQEMAGPCAIK